MSKRRRSKASLKETASSEITLGQAPSPELAKTKTLTQDAAALPTLGQAPEHLMSRFLHSPVLLHICLLTGLPLAKATEAPRTVPLLVQLEEQALVPFYLEQQQAGLGGAALGQAVQRQAKRIAAAQDALAKQLEADGVRMTRRHSRLVNALRVRVAPGKRATLAKRAGVCLLYTSDAADE